MKIKDIPSNIGEYLKYDETSPSGLRWIKRFGNSRSINIGDSAGTLNNHNYYQTKFNGKKYKNHRIIFFLQHGYCPDCIDHIDGTPQNNRIDNLREATLSQNGCNRGKTKNNKSGHKGISLNSGKYWYVCIRKNRKLVISKLFPLDQFQEACDFSDEQRKILHGDFANDGVCSSRKSLACISDAIELH